MQTESRTRVFVVEDEAVIALDLRERLEALGYAVCGHAARGESAAQKITELRPDIVLMDVNLAGPMDGVDVAQQLGEHTSVPIVFLTAYSDPDLIARASRTNAYGYLVKPFDERELHATLQVALARHAAEHVLREQVTVDALTGLYNRRFLDQMLPIEIGRANREGRTLSLAMIDIDNFKRLNDTYGHEAGDHVLRQVASLLRGAVRASDLACRYGGEEFVVVMPGVGAQDATQKMRSICAMVRESAMSYRGAPLTFTVSAGVAEAPAAGSSPQELLRVADAALYCAKEAGRDRVVEAETGFDSL